MAAKKRTSAVWQFFNEPVMVVEKGKEVKKIPCKLCDKRLADGGGTSNLMNHLEAKHPVEHEQLTGRRCKDSPSRR